MDRTYALAKAINALLVTLAGVPLYLWARRLVSPGYALLALGLFLLLPSLLYSGTLMTENAFLPAFLLADRPSHVLCNERCRVGETLAQRREDVRAVRCVAESHRDIPEPALVADPMDGAACHSPLELFACPRE